MLSNAEILTIRLVPWCNQRMLKCSSCQQRFKSHAITRCFHLFCKECIDARLETRQRKCPSCSIGFGQADVQQIYF